MGYQRKVGKLTYKYEAPFIFYLVLIVSFSCSNEKEEKNFEERIIIEKIINEKIYGLSKSKMMKTEEFANIVVNENFDYSKIEKISDSIVSNREFYFSISDTLVNIDKRSNLYKTAMNQFVFVPIEDSNISKVLHIENLVIKSNLIRVKNKDQIDSNYFLGKFKFSRVIYEKGRRERALVFMFTEDTPFLFPVVLLEKHNNEWEIE